jgi:hypothetical protein
LKENSDVVGAGVAVANGIEPMAAYQGDEPGMRGGNIGESSANAGMPGLRLFEAIQVIDDTAGGEKVETPLFVRGDGKGVFAVDQAVAFRGEFLVIVSRNTEREFGDKGENSTDPVGAEAVRLDAEAAGDIDVEILFALGKGVFQKAARPDQMAVIVDLTVLVETVTAGVQADEGFVPEGDFHGQGGIQGRLPSA